jgi:hypothetical protein
MTVFENINSKNIDELVEWLDKNGASDGNPWILWFDKTYCRKCESVVGYMPNILPDWSGEHEFAWCELNHKCKYFQNMEKIPDRKQTIKLWLESEVK